MFDPVVKRIYILDKEGTNSEFEKIIFKLYTLQIERPKGLSHVTIIILFTRIVNRKPISFEKPLNF